MSRAKKRSKKANATGINNSSFDRFGMIMDWILMHTVVLDSSRTSMQQLFTLTDYLISSYQGSELNRVIIIRRSRKFYIARVTRAGCLCELSMVAYNGKLLSEWDTYIISWDCDKTITENLTNLRFGSGGTECETRIYLHANTKDATQ